LIKRASRVALHGLLLAAVVWFGARFAPDAGAQTRRYEVSRTTGNPALDRYIQAERRSLDRLFGVQPEVLIYNDSGKPNALATLQTRRPGYDGTILFGITLLRNELFQSTFGGTAVAGIMAHEYAHVLQLRRGAGKVRVMFLELHADCMAGWYLKRSRNGRISIQPFARSIFEKGDYAYWSREHHGTPKQRITAIVAGYSAGELPRDSAYNYCVSVATRVRR